jgi:hypothetical protein
MSVTYTTKRKNIYYNLLFSIKKTQPNKNKRQKQKITENRDRESGVNSGGFVVSCLSLNTLNQGVD